MNLTQLNVLSACVDVFQKHDHNSSSVSWSLPLLFKALKEKNVAEALVPKIERPFPLNSTSSFKTYLTACRSLLFKLILFAYYEGEISKDDLLTEYQHLIQYSYWPQFQLGAIYLALCEYFLELDPSHPGLSLESSGLALIETADHMRELNLPHPMYLAELATLSMFYAALRQDDKLLCDSITLSQSLGFMLDTHLMPLKGFFMKQEDYSEYVLNMSHLAANALAFTYSEQELFLDRFHLQQKGCSKLKAKEDITIDLMILILHTVEHKASYHPHSFVQHAHLDALVLDHRLAFARYESNSLLACAAAIGFRSGVGSLQKGSLEIISMGPHLAPLGEVDRYGIVKLPLGASTSFEDVTLSKKEDGFAFNALSSMRLSSQNLTSDLVDPWIEINMEVAHDVMKLNIQAIDSSDLKEELYFAFFIKAPKAIISNTICVQPKSLDRYYGETKDIRLTDGEHRLTLSLEKSHLVHVIPLAGGDYFFGADFLIAFSLKDHQPLSFSIK